MRKKDAFRQEAARVITKHASRKDPQRHLVNNRAARSRSRAQAPGDVRQMGFDF